MPGLQIIACFLSLLSFLMLITALASDHWKVTPDNHEGLWHECQKGTCKATEMHVPSFIHATRAFVLMGMVSGAVSSIALAASFVHSRICSIPIKCLAVSASFGAGVLSMTAMSIYTGVYHHQLSSENMWFGWSFCIGWASFPLFLITAGIACLIDFSQT